MYVYKVYTTVLDAGNCVHVYFYNKGWSKSSYYIIIMAMDWPYSRSYILMIKNNYPTLSHAVVIIYRKLDKFLEGKFHQDAIPESSSATVGDLVVY